ncbi:hypothetical protein OH76DRAFT_505892 [Lentinus brumalis]|uniref:Uncharacterized protein n=1 Tax=Lentinus brumalis TaxID=2498619 RepID=A0A371CHZ1_9APHY|nr:hypothetical protein OH76DRAFT_505892 [Polyporus brumalis]
MQLSLYADTLHVPQSVVGPTPDRARRIHPVTLGLHLRPRDRSGALERASAFCHALTSVGQTHPFTSAPSNMSSRVARFVQNRASIPMMVYRLYWDADTVTNSCRQPARPLCHRPTPRLRNPIRIFCTVRTPYHCDSTDYSLLTSSFDAQRRRPCARPGLASLYTPTPTRARTYAPRGTSASRTPRPPESSSIPATALNRTRRAAGRRKHRAHGRVGRAQESRADDELDEEDSDCRDDGTGRTEDGGGRTASQSWREPVVPIDLRPVLIVSLPGPTESSHVGQQNDVPPDWDQPRSAR